ncbi:hypothetical protein BJ959_000741 [Chryseoglobus frigidaquae]|uniref:Uncharacterized protein n=1 Tax=Microcella frigidaquae TaxID=424758 RepID=A0A840X7X2_9MICO|nr:hypothetical protein [Microcella frigidaquae]
MIPDLMNSEPLTLIVLAVLAWIALAVVARRHP